MKVLILKLNDKTYTTGKITTYLSKEALKIQKESLELAKLGKQIQIAGEPDIDTVNELMTKMLELKDRKSWLICEVYGRQFSADNLEKSFSDEEIDAEINRIISGITGVIRKN
jgi:hypothetical protein